MNLPAPITQAAIGTVLANAVAVAAAFGAPLTHPQQTVLLAFAGSVTSLVFAIYAAVHVHQVSSAVKLATSPAAASAPSPGPSSSVVGAGG